MSQDTDRARRHAMVRDQLEARGIRDPRVLEAMRRVPRHLFVPETERVHAYEDRPLPIGHGQTISQPYIVAWMTELTLAAQPRRALDVGTGSGYQAAVLAEIYEHVCAIERVPELAERARATLAELGCKNVELRCADGHEGWPDAQPFDAIVVACAAAEPPPALVDQLAPGARMAIPLGDFAQRMIVLEKGADGGTETRQEGGVMFVPMLRGAGDKTAD
jgi:protein-L-isoaspartate(D-aspartate) O-methyltransferase